jgi:hypothetical protein
MARIRSIHQGFFTDERLVSCSAFARLLLIGLWTEADDQGVFEWKPITIKMRLFPIDALDVPATLSELVAADAIKKFSYDGREYGAVRNFRKFQRPKKPNRTHPLPDKFRTYVALSDASSEPTPDNGDPFPKKGEKPPQMEDGEEGRGEPPSPSVEEPGAKKGGGEGEDSANKCFELLGLSYPGWKTASRTVVVDLIKELAPSDREALLPAATGYAEEYRRKPTTRPISLEKFIREAIFRNFVVSPTLAQTRFVSIASAEWPVIARLYREIHGRDPPVNKEGSGWYFPNDMRIEMKAAE